MVSAYMSGSVVRLEQYSSSDPVFTLFMSDTPEVLKFHLVHEQSEKSVPFEGTSQNLLFIEGIHVDKNA